MKEQTTTIRIRTKVSKWLDQQKKRMRKAGKGDVIESMQKVIKFHKLEEEMR